MTTVHTARLVLKASLVAAGIFGGFAAGAGPAFLVGMDPVKQWMGGVARGSWDGGRPSLLQKAFGSNNIGKAVGALWLGITAYGGFLGYRVAKLV